VGAPPPLARRPPSGAAPATLGGPPRPPDRAQRHARPGPHRAIDAAPRLQPPLWTPGLLSCLLATWLARRACWRNHSSILAPPLPEYLHMASSRGQAPVAAGPAGPPLPDTVRGRVISAQANYMRVLVSPSALPPPAAPDGVVLLCVVRAVLKKIHQRILVGDFVRVARIDWPSRRGAVEDLLPRQNCVTEPPVANVDRVLILFAFTTPPIEEKQLTQFLVSAEVLELPRPPLLVLNKAELVPSELRSAWCERMAEWGYAARAVSVATGEGLPELAAELRGAVTVLMGPSGVGKSSLVNALRRLRHPDDAVEAEVQDITTQAVGRRSGRGRHTTRHSELMKLPGGALVADTPGFGLPTEAIEQLSPTVLMGCFPEVRAAVAARGPCGFADCRHLREPNCVVARRSVRACGGICLIHSERRGPSGPARGLCTYFTTRKPLLGDHVPTSDSETAYKRERCAHAQRRQAFRNRMLPEHGYGVP